MTSALSIGSNRDYLQDPVRIGAVLASFFVLTLPLSALSLKTPSRLFELVSVGYMVVLGFTHFAVTWVLYLHHENRKYFLSSKRNVFLYFVVPAALFVLFAALGLLDVQENSPRVLASKNGWVIFYAFAFAAVLKTFDYYHVVRQSFGVLQLLKSKMSVAKWMRTVENVFFPCMAALQVNTFIGGLRGGSVADATYDLSGGVCAPLTAICGSLFLAVAAGYGAAIYRARAEGAKAAPIVTTFLYFLLQTACASLVVYRSSLYRYSLAMHYVEYHILITPRCFDTKLDTACRSDRLVIWFRRHKVAFYALLLAAGAWIGCDLILDLGGAHATKDGNQFAWFMVNALNGVFVAHYFVEALVWRFGNPFYRTSLSPLYFTRAGKVAPAPTATS